MSNNNEKDDYLTVSRVYDTLKSPTFLKNLYWDILSGIKEKDTYKLMRGIAEGLINQNMEVLNGLNNSEADNMHRKTIVSEISVMSYTIDTVFSKILYMKLEKACKEQIINIIHELRNEGKIPENAWSRIKLNAEASGSQTSTENTAVKTNPDQLKKEVQRTSIRIGKRKRMVHSVFLDSKKADSNKEILDDLKKVNGTMSTDEDKDGGDSKKENVLKKNIGKKIKEFTKKSTSSSDTILPLKILTTDNVPVLPDSVDLISESSVPESEDFFLDDSDAESESSTSSSPAYSVSSVHTSDLSSFDDEISLSSDDENGDKKKVPLKEVQMKYSKNSKSSTLKKTNANSSKSTKSKKPFEKVAEDKDIKMEVSVNDMAKSTSQSASFESPNEYGLSKRARKPNSRYSSDTILCPAVKVKERKKPLPAMKANQKISNDETSPQKKIKVEDDDNIYVDVTTITRSIDNEESNNSMKTPAKQLGTPDLYKSHSSNRSLTSRRTAPLTLFST